MRFCFKGCVNIHPPRLHCLTLLPKFEQIEFSIVLLYFPLVGLRQSEYSFLQKFTDTWKTRQVPVSGELSTLPMPTPFSIVCSRRHTHREILAIHQRLLSSQ